MWALSVEGGDVAALVTLDVLQNKGFNMTSAPVKLLTVGVIADALGTTPERVAYLIRTRRIHPSATAGNARLFKAQDMARLRYEINLLDARSAGGGDRG